MKVIILAGGSGTRLWPISRSSFPKQFLHFGDDKSLLQKTLSRFLPIISPQDFLIVTGQEYYHLVKNQAREVHLQLEKQILVEPERKNTGPAILLGVKYLIEAMGACENDCFIVSSSDHIIFPETEFIKSIELAGQVASEGFNVTFGIRPHKPETGYGYIKTKIGPNPSVLEVDKFVEKPDYAAAQKYLMSGDYLWNSGIFVFKIETFLRELEKHCPSLTHFTDFKAINENFSSLPEISIDYALMEKSQQTKVVPLNVTWSDVGSWDSVYDTLDKDQNQNVKIGNIIDIDTKNCLIFGDKRLISTLGLEDLLIVETEDALFIGKKGESQRVKSLVEELKKRKAKEPFDHLTTHRPWGSYTILEESERYKIKRIVVDPLQRLSLQMHYHRSEHWVVVKGTAKVTVDDRELLVHENESIYVPKSSVHRLENPGKVTLEIIEVQVGEYLGEDDIVRFEDVYGRSLKKESI